MSNNLLKTFYLILIIILVNCGNSIINVNGGSVAPINCCVNENIYIVEMRECEFSQIRLHCEYGRYILDPEIEREDYYQVTQDGHLNILDTNSIVYRHDYCITNRKPNKTSEIEEIREVAMVCFPAQPNSALYYVKAGLSLVSVVFLIFTLYIYAILRDLRDTQDKVTICAITCLAIFFLFLAINQIFNRFFVGSWVCSFIAFVIYFFVIGYFSWLNMVMANVWKLSVLRRWKIKEFHWFLLTNLYGWGVPIILTIISIIGYHTELYAGPSFERKCWFADRVLQWKYMYIPVTLMLAINTVFFIWSCISLHLHGKDISPDKIKALTYKIKIYVSLFLLSGLTWIFEILSHHFESNGGSVSFWIITDIINCLQGALIAFILIFWRKRVRRALANRRICCLRLPGHWSQFKDTEEDILHEEDTE